MIAFEFAYSKSQTPAAISDCPDHRLLAINFNKVFVKELGKTPRILSFDDCIFGLHKPEPHGTWSSGKKSCFFISKTLPATRSIELEIDAHCYEEAFRSCRMSIRTSSGHCGSVQIGKRRLYQVTLRKPLLPRRKRLVVGDFTKIKTPLNVSHQCEIPTVSIVFLNYERSDLTHFASVAAASSQPKVPFEILCADNGSSRESISELRGGEVPIRILELRGNLGFGVANNLAAREARGEYLLFLNNDAFLDKGAVDEMLCVFRAMPDCRIAGSIFRFPDGTMQEAGASLQPDGQPIRHGRNDQKFKTRKLPRYQQVDYVSGACMMIRKSDFLMMGGFAEKYSPAYYEDTDLCMRTLLYGQKVYLASRANCYHIENATTSTIDDGAWAKRTAEAHREIILKDWEAYLASRDPKDLPRHLAQ